MLKLMKRTEKLLNSILKSRSCKKNMKVINELEEIDEELDTEYQMKRIDTKNCTMFSSTTAMND